MKSPPFHIRAFEPGDADRVADIFFRSVREVAKSRYDEAQIEAWISSVPEPSKWLPYLIAFYTYLAIDEYDEAVAWISMRADGYIDMLFCLPEAVGRGAAGQLYETVERIATELGLSRMTAHASLFAQPFFAKRGWKVEQHEVHVQNGVDIPRATMWKDLALQTTV